MPYWATSCNSVSVSSASWSLGAPSTRQSTSDRLLVSVYILSTLDSTH